MRLLLVFLTAALMSSSLFSQDFNKLYDKGLSSLKNKKFKQAEDYFNRAEELDTTNKKLYFHRGEARFHLGKKEGACADWINAYENGSKAAYDKIQQNCLSEDQKKVNLGKGVNSRYVEIGPIISPDGKTLYICRGGHPQNIGPMKHQDIWVSTLNEKGEWSPAVNIGPPLNNAFANHVQSVSPDGNTLLLGNSYNFPDNDFAPCITHRTKNGWGKPEKLNIKDFHNNGNYLECCLFDDGKILLMALERRETFGGGDIYVSFRNENGTWSKPMNLGPEINTMKDETSPFLASDGQTLYFSSRGHPGFGESDVFMSIRLDSTWQNWSKPRNLGYLINSPGFDGFYRIPAAGDYAYFASHHNAIGQVDIFKIKLPELVKPKPVILVYGKVLNAKTKEPVDAKVYYEILPDGKEAGIARSNPKTGEYKITLPSGQKYGFRAEAQGYLSVNDNLDAVKVEKYEEIERNLELAPIEKGQNIRLNNLFFELGSWKLRPESYPELKRLISFLKENPKVIFEVAGHTDDIGSEENNLGLSRKRAQNVADYITDKGIDKSRVLIKGYGETMPAAPNDTPAGRQKNRRVEFKILEK